MPQPLSRQRARVLGAAAASGLMLLSGTAHAGMFGEELPFLLQLIGVSTSTLDSINNQLETLRKTYQATQRVASLVDDARQAFVYVSHLNSQMLGAEAMAALNATFPDVAWFHREASRGGLWRGMRGRGELRRLVMLCLRESQGERGGPVCVELEEALTMQDARDALTATFGTVPEGTSSTREMADMDTLAATGIAGSSAQMGRNEVTKAQLDALMQSCIDRAGDSQKNIEACKVAAATADIRAAQQLVEISNQLAQANELQSARVAQENARLKRETRDAQRRGELLHQVQEGAVPQPLEVRTEGFHFTLEGGN